MKWYIINLLAAYCISNIGRNIDEQLEKLLQLDNVIHEIKNQRFKKALTPLIFYFLPITLIDLPSGVTAVASLIGINRNIIKVIWRITLIVLMIRTPTVVLITIFVLPPFRKAFFDLLGIKRRQQITVIPLHNNFLISR
uniref:Bm13152 n=1 Tax=Brugia malayi TaxID=6279 RepID=A0A1I9GDV1_BRUMA|nr:Bm13152 [Brugia malayi]